MPYQTMTPLKAIRAKCRDCMGNSAKQIEACFNEKCSLHPYRFGKSPNRKGRVMTDEQKAAARERLAKARAVRDANKAAKAAA